MVKVRLNLLINQNIMVNIIADKLKDKELLFGLMDKNILAIGNNVR